MATPSAENNSSTADDKKAMRSTRMVRTRRLWAWAPSCSVVACTAPRPRKVDKPRKRSSKNEFMSPSWTNCSSLAALARQPTIAMNMGIRGAAQIKIKAATQD